MDNIIYWKKSLELTLNIQFNTIQVIVSHIYYNGWAGYREHENLTSPSSFLTLAI